MQFIGEFLFYVCLRLRLPLCFINYTIYCFVLFLENDTQGQRQHS